MPQKDPEKRKEYNRQQYLKNKDKNKDKNKCEHNRVKSTCKECCGGSVCEHGRQKSTCKDCGGSCICEHNRVKSTCKECKGGNICEHGRRKSTCKECKGGSICEHNRMKQVCKECGGSGICKHNRYKARCKDCSIYTYLINLQRNSLKRVLKSSTLEKTKPTIEYLGCDAIYFKNYIQSKMTEGMAFDNIHIDHIKPVSSFNLEDHEEFLKCCHYTNFQPLLVLDNLIKSDIWNEEDEQFWRENITDKEYLPLYFPFQMNRTKLI